MDFINENIGWVGGENGSIFKTENGGQTWEQQFDGEDELYLYTIIFQNENIGWTLTNH